MSWKRSSINRASAILVVTALAAVTATGASAADGDDAAHCVYYETPYKQEIQVSTDDGGTRCVSAAEAAAIAEAAGWPNFDPSDMTAEIAAYEAQQEAAAWPNFDSTAISPGASVDVASGDAEVAVHPQRGAAF